MRGLLQQVTETSDSTTTTLLLLLPLLSFAATFLLAYAGLLSD